MLAALSTSALPPVPGSPLVLMVSGGSDSMAMLVRCVRGEVDLFDGAGPRRPDPRSLHVLHVNHCLRGAEADRDEEFVRTFCLRAGVDFRAVRVDVPALVAAGANFEDAAREARYEAAWELACACAREAGVDAARARVLVAHTADDRAETFLMRAMAGAGTSGLSGMRRVRGLVVRPLLDETREGLREYLRAEGVGWCEDSTNECDDALRSYVRHRVTPPMRARAPRFAEALGRTLDVMACEDDLLERLARASLDGMLLPSRQGFCVLDAAALAAAEPALAPRCLRLALLALLGERGFAAARFEARHLGALLELAARPGGSCDLPGGVSARVEGAALVLRSASAPEPPADVELVPGGEVVWGDVRIAARLVEAGEGGVRETARRLASELEARGLGQGRDFVLVDARACGFPEGALTVGSPRPGERMVPFGMAGTKLLSDLLPQAGVPLRDRPWVPVVRGRDGASGAESCVWVGGIRLDARAAWNHETTSLIQLSIAY